jgi:hypothetical protein
MDERMSKEQILFSNIVIMFQTAAMQHMGKLKNPISDKIERDIEQAKISIDILEMIQKKTEGNLDEYEQKLLKSVLQELRLNYVYERDRKDEGTADRGEHDEKAADENTDDAGSDTPQEEKDQE